MQINQSEVKDLTAVLTMTVEPADYQEAVNKELRQFRQKANVPGFRPGMVPMGLVKKMYGKSVMAEVINKEIGTQLSKYIEDNQLQVIGEPLPNEELTPKVDFDTQDTFTFAFDIALTPEFDAKLNGKNKLTYYHITVTDEMVDKQVKSYQSRFGEFVDAEEVSDGDVLKGRMVEQKENGMVKEDAILNPQYMKDESQAALFKNAKKGDIVTFNPMKAFDSEVEVSSLLGISKDEVKNLASDFTFELQVINHREDAKIDGELFAKVYGENTIKDEADFRQHVKEEIEKNMDEDSKYKYGLDVKETIMKKMEKVELPKDFLRRLIHAGNDKVTDEEIDKDFPSIIDNLKWTMAKEQLMKHFAIQVQQEDVLSYAKEVARMQFLQYGLMHIDDQYLTNFANEMLKKEDQLRNIIERVSENKIYEALKTVVKLEEKEISHEDFGKLFA